jgi:hypothetical protein
MLHTLAAGDQSLSSTRDLYRFTTPAAHKRIAIASLLHPKACHEQKCQRMERDSEFMTFELSARMHLCHASSTSLGFLLQLIGKLLAVGAAVESVSKTTKARVHLMTKSSLHGETNTPAEYTKRHNLVDFHASTRDALGRKPALQEPGDCTRLEE